MQSFGTSYNDAIEVTETATVAFLLGTDTLNTTQLEMRRYFVSGQGLVRVENDLTGVYEQRIVRQ